MSLLKVRLALEIAFNAIPGGVAIAWEGSAYAPTSNTPFQKVNLVPATPENPTFGDMTSEQIRETGFLQITLYYPLQLGVLAIMTRAELIRTTFARGLSFTNSGVTVRIPRTPKIYPAFAQDNYFVMVVEVPYWADVFV